MSTLVEHLISRWALCTSQWQVYSAIVCVRADPLHCNSRMRLWLCWQWRWIWSPGNNDDSQVKLQQAMLRRQELLDRIRVSGVSHYGILGRLCYNARNFWTELGKVVFHTVIWKNKTKTTTENRPRLGALSKLPSKYSVIIFLGPWLQIHSSFTFLYIHMFLNVLLRQLLRLIAF